MISWSSSSSSSDRPRLLADPATVLARWLMYQQCPYLHRLHPTATASRHLRRHRSAPRREQSAHHGGRTAGSLCEQAGDCLRVSSLPSPRSSVSMLPTASRTVSSCARIPEHNDTSSYILRHHKTIWLATEQQSAWKLSTCVERLLAIKRVPGDPQPGGGGTAVVRGVSGGEGFLREATASCSSMPMPLASWSGR